MEWKAKRITQGTENWDEGERTRKEGELKGFKSSVWEGEISEHTMPAKRNSTQEVRMGE